MSDDKKGFGITEKIVVPVVVALLVGGTSPWWWTTILTKRPEPRPTDPSSPRTPAPVGTAGQRTEVDAAPKNSVETPASLSHTRYSLEGDEVSFFRVVSRTGRQLIVDVDYKYNDQHGSRVVAGAWLKGVNSGYKPVAFVPSIGQGTVQVEVNISEPGNSTGIEIFLYEYGKAGEIFARRYFPFQNSFK